MPMPMPMPFLVLALRLTCMTAQILMFADAGVRHVGSMPLVGLTHLTCTTPAEATMTLAEHA